MVDRRVGMLRRTLKFNGSDKFEELSYMFIFVKVKDEMKGGLKE